MVRCRYLLSAGATLAVTLGAAATADAESPHFTPEFSCTGVTVVLAGFPDLPVNEVKVIVTADHAAPVVQIFSFDGPTASETIPLHLTAGHHQLDVRVQWPRTGIPGGHDHPLVHGIHCAAEGSFTIEKLEAAGTHSSFTTGPVFGTRRELVRYEILVTNTGDVPLTLSALSDPGCDPGTISGGTGGAPLEPTERAVFECSHRLTEGDQAAGSYENIAGLTATPPEGPPIIESSNPVLVDLPHDPVGFGCDAITFYFEGFPDLPDNTVQEIVTIDHGTQILTTFSFDGPSGSNTVPLLLVPGRHKLDAWARWDTNGVHGGHDQHAGGNLLCTSETGE